MKYKNCELFVTTQQNLRILDTQIMVLYRLLRPIFTWKNTQRTNKHFNKFKTNVKSFKHSCVIFLFTLSLSSYPSLCCLFTVIYYNFSCNFFNSYVPFPTSHPAFDFIMCFLGFIV